MKNLLLLLLLPLLGIALSCKNTKHITSNAENAATSAYQYNSETGKCQDHNGKPGLNKVDLARVRQDKNCECADLTGIDLVDLLPGITEANRYSYNKLDQYNFRGANLKQAKINFNDLVDCDFSGAQMKTFSYGYTQMNGKVDKFTVLPESGCDEVKDGKIYCRR